MFSGGGGKVRLPIRLDFQLDVAFMLSQRGLLRVRIRTGFAKQWLQFHVHIYIYIYNIRM